VVFGRSWSHPRATCGFRVCEGESHWWSRSGKGIPFLPLLSALTTARILESTELSVGRLSAFAGSQMFVIGALVDPIADGWMDGWSDGWSDSRFKAASSHP